MHVSEARVANERMVLVGRNTIVYDRVTRNYAREHDPDSSCYASFAPFRMFTVAYLPQIAREYVGRISGAKRIQTGRSRVGLVHSMVLLPRFSSGALVIAGSVLLHAGAAMALVATSSGHARADIVLASATLDLAPIEVPVEPLLEPVAENVEAHEHASAPTHTHDYPVAPDHDAHPHDPSLKHDALGVHSDHHEEAPAQAAPVLTAPPDPFAALPQFALPSGAGGATAHGNVTSNANAAGSGAGVGLGGAGHDDDAIVPASGVHVPARLVSSVVASYPMGARADDVEGDVVVEVVLDRNGQVIDARVSRPAGHGFDDAALAAIRRYRFSPAQRDGHAVRVRMPWTVQFRLR